MNDRLMRKHQVRIISLIVIFVCYNYHLFDKNGDDNFILPNFNEFFNIIVRNISVKL